MRLRIRWSAVGKTLLAALIFVHFVVLALNALPSSRFVGELYPYYGWYPTYTGQAQVWAMYQRPDRIRGDYELLARMPDASIERPWGTSRQMSARQVYFIEGVLLGGDKRLSDRFFDTLRRRWPSQPLPKAMSVRRTSVVVNDFENVPKRGTLSGKPTRREVERQW